MESTKTSPARDLFSLADLYSAVTDVPFLAASTSFFGITGTYLLSISVIFPFYVYVYRSNRKRDEGVSVYPITNHFYNVVVFMQFYLYLAFMAIIIPLIAPIPSELKSFTVAGIIVIFLCFGYFSYGIITMVQNFLLFFLALQRFLIYSYPKCDSYISPTKQKFKRIIIYVYITMIVLHAALRVLKMVCFPLDGIEYETCFAPYDDIYMYVYISAYFLVLIASVFYVIMLFKIRQFAKTASGMRSKPDKYILYQTIILIAMKLLLVPLSVTTIAIHSELSLELIFGFCLAIDIATTPFVIQVSYLVCNKNNVDTLLSIPLRNIKTWLVLCCGAPPSVASTDSFDITSTSNQQRNKTYN